MKFVALTLDGPFVIEPELLQDERGYFARTFCRQEFAQMGLHNAYEQCSVSFNAKKGTIRGLHFQQAPHEEIKLVRCTRGAAWDVIVDLRPESATFKQWLAVEISAKNETALYIPAGFAHGFQTLHDGTELLYQISTAYVAEAAAGIRFNDPELSIEWPLKVSVISVRDANLPLVSEVKLDGSTSQSTGAIPLQAYALE